jgi:Protein of unknown function (DUF3631)
MPKWDSTPRIAFLSPEPASGKSRALEVSELLVPNSVTSVNVSATYLFRKVGSDEGATVLFDEVDTIFGPKAKEHEEIRGLLNAGHRQGATAGRCFMNGKTVQTEEIHAYAAVALAGLGWLPDTIMGRSIIIRMRRRHQGERVEPFRRRIVEPEGRELHRMLDAWARTVGQINWPEMPPGIEDQMPMSGRRSLRSLIWLAASGPSSLDMVRDIGTMLTRPPLNGSKVELIIDETGVGRAVGDIFNSHGLKPLRISITAGHEATQSGYNRYSVPKQELVSAIDAMLHTELRESATLESELKDFRRHVSEAGRYSYAAREGKHDDLVLAVAIALWRAVKRKARFDGPSKKPRVLYGYEHAKRHLRHG